MAWISGNRYLSTLEMQNNALIVKSYLYSRGWTLNAIAGLLGNMQSESTINPGIWESLDEGNYSMGYGLVQWTPATNYTDWATENNYAIDDGNAQLKWIDEETASFGQWIATSEYNMTFAEFKTSTSTPEHLASAFLKNFERAGVEVEEARRSQARTWYTYIKNSSSSTEFTPRLTDEGIEGSFYYYDQNPLYIAGYGLPNCTCYAWGRFWEISDSTGDGSNKPTLPLTDAGTWYGRATDYLKGQTPQLGAVICWSDNAGGAGHVAIVEEIKENGDIVTSNSAYGSTFFYIKDVIKANGYNTPGFTFQGFIYNPFVSAGKKDKKKKKKKFNFVLFTAQKRRQAMYKGDLNYYVE